VRDTGIQEEKNMSIPASHAGMTSDCAANGELFECEITRKEFEQASNPLVERTINTFSPSSI
jgi:molecular chaperone HscA